MWAALVPRNVPLKRNGQINPKSSIGSHGMGTSFDPLRGGT